MRKLFTYLSVAVMAAAVFSSCEKEKENPILNPSGSPVQFTFTSTAVSETEATLKVTSDVPVPADVTIALATDATNNMAGMTFPAEVVVAKGTTEATATLTVDKDALTPEVAYKAVITASIAGTQFGKVTALTITVPKPAPVTVDGEIAEWANLPSDYVTEIKCGDGATYQGLKSAKIFYDEKLYVLLEVTDEVLATGVTEGKVRLHFFFDSDYDKTNGCNHKWNQPAIDYMLEGKMTASGEWCALSSKYYKWTGTDPTLWGPWTADDASPTFTYAGKGNYYECAMDYSNYPGGLGKVIGMGFDTQDNGYAITGMLPSAGKLAQVVKNGEPIPEEEVEVIVDGDFSEWKSVPSIAGNDAIRTMKMQQTAEKLYFYVEIDKTNENIKLDETLPYAHRLMLCFDNGDNKGSFGNDDWGGARYDVMYGVWIMQNGVANMACFDVSGFEHAETDGDVMKFEFGFNKPDHEVFSGSSMLYGAYLNSQYVEGETWNGEEGFHAGSAPASNHCLAYIGEPIAPSVDGNMSEWVAYDGVCHGNYGMFKVASDAQNLYFYSYRTTGDRYSAIWGGSGYIYLAFDIDGDETNGVVLNSNGPYDFIGFFMPYYGTLEAPEIKENAGEGGDSLPEPYNLLGMKCKGFADETGAYIEYSVPRSNLPAIPTTPIKITSWGNKDLHKVSITCTL